MKRGKKNSPQPLRLRKKRKSQPEIINKEKRGVLTGSTKQQGPESWDLQSGQESGKGVTGTSAETDIGTNQQKKTNTGTSLHVYKKLST